MKTIMRFRKHSPTSIIFICMLLLVGFFPACSSDDNDDNGNESITTSYEGTFVPSTSSVTTSATGTVSANYNSSTMMLTYTANWNGLGTDAAAMHFHNDGPVMQEITGFPTATSGSASGYVSLTAVQASDLAAGKIYIQIHTIGYPSGEVIATLTKKSTGGSGGSGGSGGGSGGY